MAKRELSTTLKNLKCFQLKFSIKNWLDWCYRLTDTKGAQKEEKPKQEVEESQETKPDGKFVSPNNVNRKCVVILEGDPHPGTLRGRISFQNFNPSIDKLNDQAANSHEAEASTSSGFQTGRNIGRENGELQHTGMNIDHNDADRELKRKQSEATTQKNHRKKLQKDVHVNKQASPSENSSRKQSKRDKLDYKVLVPPKSQNKKKGG